MSHAGLGLREEPLYQGTLGAGDLGSSRNHLSSFIPYTFNTKIFTYHAFGNQDTIVLYEPSDPRCWIGVNGLSYCNSYQAEQVVIVRRLLVTCCKHYPERRGL